MEISQHQKTQRASGASLRPVLASYTDFREYLKDFYQFKRSTESSRVRAYSYSTFSAAADIKSPNYLKLIIEGKRNLSDDMVDKFAKALQLAKGEVAEFRALVHYGQAKDPLDRNQCLKELSDLRVRQQLESGEINTADWSRIPNWITWVIYSLADQKQANFDLQNLRKLMRGRANLDQIKKSMDVLLESGQLVKDEQTGEISKGTLPIEGFEKVPAALVRKLQAELIYLGLESLAQDEPQEREFGALTLSLTKTEFEKLKFELRQLKKRIQKDISVEREQSKGERVYQMNIQLFPVTDPSLSN